MLIEWNKYNPEEDKKEDSGSVALLSLNSGVDKNNKNNLIFDPNLPFKFYTVLTDFDVNDTIVDMVTETPGIEIHNLISRYRFVVSIGSLFNDKEVIHTVNTKIINYFKQNNQSIVVNDADLTDEQKHIVEYIKQKNKDQRENWNEIFTDWYSGYTLNPFQPFFASILSDNSEIISNFKRFVQSQISFYNLRILDQKQN